MLKLCPCRRMDEETDDHVLTCTENPGREKAMRQLRKEFDSASVLPTTKLFKQQLIDG
jgi:hypothetical protein